MNADTARLSALKLAVEGGHEPPDQIIERAEAYFKFLTADGLSRPLRVSRDAARGRVGAREPDSEGKSLQALAAMQAIVDGGQSLAEHVNDLVPDE